MDLYGSPNSDPNSSIRLCVCTKYPKLVGPVVPFTPGVRLTYRSRMFTRPWQTICSERHFCTDPVRICTAPRSQTRTCPLRCVCTSCVKVGGPVAPCSTGVRLQDCSRMFNRLYQTICSKRYFSIAPVRFCTAPVRFCTASQSRTRTAQLGCVCVYKLQHTSRARCTLYTRCTTPTPYGSPNSDRNSALMLCVYNLYQTGRSRRTLYNRCTTQRPLTDVLHALLNNLK